ncbi:hypothetical protein [Sedimenticola sp.]|uniref:hypothetical protein n=1 Tax=Sedimenticola sp. TaxID=1940285 RepID=UPI003D0CBC5C
MRVKKALLITVVIGVATYAAVKGAVYYKVKTELDKVVAMAAPFAALKYDGIESDLKGSVSVTGVSVMPAQAPVAIQIERVELQGEGTRFLLGLLIGFDTDQPPQRLRVSIKRMRVPLGSTYLDYFSNGATAETPALCSLGGLLGQTELEKLGFRQRIVDTRLRYDLNLLSEEFTLLTDYAMEGLSSLSMELVMNHVGRPQAMMAGALPSLGRFSLHYRLDPDYMQNAIAYCAGEAGLDKAAFIDQLFAQDEAYFAKNLGFIPGDGLLSALRRLVSQPGELLITARPDSQINPAQLQQFKVPEMIERLGIQLSVNDQPVSDLSFKLPGGHEALADLLEEAAPDGADVPGQAAAASAAPAKPPRVRFLATPLAELTRYVGRDVRLFSSDRTEPQQGILIGLRDQQLELEQRLYGGKMTLYIPLNKIRRAEVFRREE